MRKTIQSILSALFVMFIFSGCSSLSGESATLDMESVKKDIQAMENAYAEGEKKKDADAVVAYYTQDAVSYSSNKEPLSGKEAIKQSIKDRMAKDTTGDYSVYKTLDLFGEGNSLVEIGSWTKFNAAGKEIDKGHYMSCFQKKDGKYLCVRDMSVSSNPAK